MARLPRICLPGIPQHIIQRGNNRQACFASEEDFAAFDHWLTEYSSKYHVAIHAWVFMTNQSFYSDPERPDGREYRRYPSLLLLQCFKILKKFFSLFFIQARSIVRTFMAFIGVTF